MKKILTIAMLLCITILAGCSKDISIDSNKTITAKAAGDLKDGKYSSAFDRFQSNGWKAFLEIEVKNGKIIKSNFGYRDKAGKLEVESIETDRLMKSTVGIGPVGYTPKINESILRKQSADIDVITGATGSVGTAKKLLIVILEKAEKGDTSETVLNLE